MQAADTPRTRDGRRHRLLVWTVLALLLAFVAIAAVVSAHAGGGLDGRAVSFLAAHRREPVTQVALVLARVGVWWVVLLIVIVLFGMFWAYNRRAQAVYLTFAIATSLVLNAALKLLYQRQPPGGTVPAIKASLYAFPSGHTMTATTVAAALAVIAWPTRWRWPVAVVAALFAVAMGASRVYLGVHWPSDVAAGWAMGLVVALGVRALLPWNFAGTKAGGEAPPAAAGDAVAPATPRTPPPLKVAFLDWGNTLMVDDGSNDGPMHAWPSVEAVDGAREALEELHLRCRVVVLTNAEDSPAWAVREALARVGLDDLVDDVISSADVGDRKPHYAFYRAALLHEGFAGAPLDPLAAVMVGDGTTNDILGAQRAGLRTIWFNPGKRPYPDGQRKPDAVIRKLTQLPVALDRLVGVKPRRLAKGSAAAASATPVKTDPAPAASDHSGR